tara:strand:- start:218 stop:565 length:348 start_codon:yes stop_codon:yes gene_type:complete
MSSTNNYQDISENYPQYEYYCDKCGDCGHKLSDCCNVNKEKLKIIETNHQFIMVNALNEYVSFLSQKNKRGKYECADCKKCFGRYKYLVYHQIYRCDHQEQIFNDESHSNIIILR